MIYIYIIVGVYGKKGCVRYLKVDSLEEEKKKKGIKNKIKA